MVAQVAGVDEAGRGALVGNVVAAAVILPATFNLPGLTDSKKLSARQREVLFDAITAQALAWCAAAASPAEIDAMNIHHATLLAMRRAVEGLATPPQSVLVDGKFTPDLAMPARAIVGGDFNTVRVRLGCDFKRMHYVTLIEDLRKKERDSIETLMANLHE